MHAPIRSSQLDLVVLPLDTLELIHDGDVMGVEKQLGVAVDPDWPSTVPTLWRLEQLRMDPAQLPWLVRAMILRASGRVVGHAGFHAPPDPDRRVEVGYSVLPSYRRRGYARESVLALTKWAYATNEATTCAARVGQDNEPSLKLLASLGFTHVRDELDERIFERDLP